MLAVHDKKRGLHDEDLEEDLDEDAAVIVPKTRRRRRVGERAVPCVDSDEDEEEKVVAKPRRRRPSVKGSSEVVSRACVAFKGVPSSVLWIILRFLPPFKTLPGVLRAVPALWRFVRDHITTDKKLFQWFQGSIPFSFHNDRSGAIVCDVVPLISVGGVWPALMRICHFCDVCHKFVVGAPTIDSGLWVLAHAKCLSDNLCRVCVPGLDKDLKGLGAPTSEQSGLFVRGSAWVPPGKFPHVWTVFGVVATESLFCGLTPGAKAELHKEARQLYMARKSELQQTVDEHGRVASKLARVAVAEKKRKAEDLTRRRKEAHAQRMQSLEEALVDYVGTTGVAPKDRARMVINL